MGFIKNNYKKILTCIICLTAVYVGILFLYPYFLERRTEIKPDISGNLIVEKTEHAPSESGLDITSENGLEVHYIDVGQGDAILIICNGEAMLIDAGDDSCGTKMQNYLKNLGINKLKFVIATHPDADHIGGLDTVIYKFDCENILMPDAASDTKAYSHLIDAIKHKGYKALIPDAKDTFSIGSAEFEILSPFKAYPYSDTNNNSLVIRLDYGEKSFLFMGDACVQPQQVLIYDDELSIKADVVKIPHHGSHSAYMKAFYDEVKPEYAVISCEKGNSYGHPHRTVLKDLKDRGVKLFRTDEQGTIIAKCDGKNITFNVNPSENWEPGEVADNYER